jgi:small-conductance mechanosensitive channel
MKALYSCILSGILLFLILSVNGQQMPGGISQIFPDSISAAATQPAQPTDSSPLETTEWRVTSNKAFWAIILFIVTWIVLKYLTSILEQIGERRVRYRLLIKGSIPIIRILIWIGMMYFIVANVIAPPWATLFALLASAGIAIGFASQDILKNIFGGIMILFDRPFQV